MVVCASNECVYTSVRVRENIVEPQCKRMCLCVRGFVREHVPFVRSSCIRLQVNVSNACACCECRRAPVCVYVCLCSFKDVGFDEGELRYVIELTQMG